MVDINYFICSNPIGSGNICKVYKIKEINKPQNIKIAKVYEQTRIQKYYDERNILNRFSQQNHNNQNDYIIKLLNIDVHLPNDENYPVNSRHLIFDYLSHGKLCDYLYVLPQVGNIKEDHVKLLCYKLLIGIRNCHENNISHNRIDIQNIMFDNDFNPIIIHFSEASLENNNNFGKDFFCLGVVLAKLITSGKFKSICKKGNKYYIKTNNNTNQKNIFEESKFWGMIGIKISENFKKFFDTLIRERNNLNINDLFNNEWIKDVNLNLSILENQLKEDFKKIHDSILDSQEKNKYDIENISSIIGQQKENYNSIINECCQYEEEKYISNKDSQENTSEKYDYENNNNMINYDKTRSINEEEDEQYNNLNTQIKSIQFEPKDIQFNYIEININNNEDVCKDIMKKYLKELNRKITMYSSEKFNINSKYLDGCLGLEISFIEKNNNEENEDDELETFDEDSNNYDLPCIINIEVIKYESDDYSPKNKYYLMFNYIQGNMADYFYYLDILKKLSKSIFKY